MSDSKKIPGPPPDDFSKTTPNVKLPSGDTPADWDKTNYNFPRQPVPDDWGKTVTNIKPIDTGAQPDYGKTMYPGAQKPSAGDWGVSKSSAESPAADFGSAPDDFGGARNDKTTPYFQLPEAERAKYQNLPPTPAEQAAKAESEKKGGIPSWVWVVAGLFAMFFFAVAVLLLVYLFVLRDTSFEASVKGAPPGSNVLVDDSPWGVTSEDGSIKLANLKAGRRTIKIAHPNYTCEAREVNGGNGVKPEPVIARCQAVVAKATDDCANIRLGEEDKAERCYYAALAALPDPFTPEDLVRALNILVINFASGKSDLPPVRLAALQKGAEYIKKVPGGVVLEVGGHTDNVGGDASNQTLSDARAAAVKSVLVKFGVADSALQTRGYGATKPKTGAGNATEQGRFYNRRIEYSVVRR